MPMQRLWVICQVCGDAGQRSAPRCSCHTHTAGLHPPRRCGAGQMLLIVVLQRREPHMVSAFTTEAATAASSCLPAALIVEGQTIDGDRKCGVGEREGVITGCCHWPRDVRTVVSPNHSFLNLICLISGPNICRKLFSLQTLI